MRRRNLGLSIMGTLSSLKIGEATLDFQGKGLELGISGFSEERERQDP
jgi:hypothetical protein